MTIGEKESEAITFTFKIRAPSSNDMKVADTAAVPSGARARAADYVALAKPRLNLLVVASTLVGYAMADGELERRRPALDVGTALVAGGASAFNQVIERDSDA